MKNKKPSLKAKVTPKASSPSSKLTWHNERRKVSNLVPNDANPRVMSPKQVDDLKKSLEKFNLVEIPVINLDNKVIAGHQRLMILKLLGREQQLLP